jgi:hypothetical protein
VVNLLLPFRVGGVDAGTRMFAFARWVLPRVPTIGEEILIDAINLRVKIEGVRWDVAGRVRVHLQEVAVRAEGVEALQRDDWTVAPWEDEPSGDWFDG